MLVIDVVVVGHSLTGCLSAIALRERGFTTALFACLENEGMESLIKVPSSPLNTAEISGAEFASLVQQRVESSGVVGYNRLGLGVTLDDDDVYTITTDDAPVKTRCLVFAPVGSEMGAPELGADKLYGMGVSTDAWSDAPLMRQLAVAVLGSGLRAAEQALIAVNSGVGRVSLICEQLSPRFGDLDDAVARSAIEVLLGTRVTGLTPGSGVPPQLSAGTLDAICLHSAPTDKDMMLDAKYLFLARGLVVDWTKWLGVHHSGQSRFIAAGLATGVPYDNRMAMVEDARRAVLEATRILVGR